MTTILVLTITMLVCTTAKAATPKNVRVYARELVLKRWHSLEQWRAFDAIIRPESGWDPCAYYPGSHDCGYRGSASCGIPQANPCPSAWRGRMWETRFAQVRWAVDYMAGRYGSPLGALAFRSAHGYY